MYIMLYLLVLLGGISLSLEVQMKKRVKTGIGGVDHYVEHLKNLGKYSLKYTGKMIIKNINVKRKALTEVDAANTKYRKKIQNYCDHVAKTYGSIEHKYTRIIDSEFLFRNILETAWKTLYRTQRNLLKEITEKITTTKDKVEKTQRVIEIINKQMIEVKKGELKYICNKYEFCAPYPSFTDYLENFIIQLLALSDDKLSNLMYLLKNISDLNNDFQILTYGVQAKDIDIIKEAQYFCGDRSLKECLSALKAILSQRFQIIVCPDKVLSVRIQATRILLNFLDKTFYQSRGNAWSDYDTTINALQAWNKNEPVLPKPIIELFVKNILRTITLSENVLKGALIEIIVTGEPNYDGLNKFWFVSGYAGVYVNMTKPINMTIKSNTSTFGSFEYLSKFL